MSTYVVCSVYTWFVEDTFTDILQPKAGLVQKNTTANRVQVA